MTLYHIIRPVITLAFRLYFKKIQHFGAEKIPLGKPLIFSVNHPTGFFEPTVLACTFWEHDFYFITRGDMFKKPFYRRILESFFMIPIYRFRDGFADMRLNQASMDLISQRLSEGKKIMIFSEGSTKTVKRLRPLQKGMARMAFANFDKYGDLDLQIVPVGLTYSAPHEPRGEIMIRFGDAIPLSIYLEKYGQNAARSVNDLTTDVAYAMQNCVVHVAREEDDALAERLFLLYRNTFPLPVFPVMEHSERRLLAQQEMATNLNQLTDNQRLALTERADIYFSTLEKNGIEDLAVAQPFHDNFNNLLTLIVGFVPFIVGWFGHWLPMWYARKVRNERVRFLEFKGPVFAGVAVGATLTQYILLIIVAVIVGKLAFCIFVFLLPFAGFYALIYNDLWKNYRAVRRLKQLDTVDEGNPDKIGKGSKLPIWQAERTAILQTVR